MTTENYPIPGHHYLHYKGGKYIVIGVATHTELNEYVVVYHKMDNENVLFVRPLNMWLEEVDGVPRFKRHDIL